MQNAQALVELLACFIQKGTETTLLIGDGGWEGSGGGIYGVSVVEAKCLGTVEHDVD